MVPIVVYDDDYDDNITTTVKITTVTTIKKL